MGGLRESSDWPLLAWLNCHEPVELIHPDGRRESFVSGHVTAGLHAAHHAVLLPGDEVLFMDLKLPDLPEGELVDAIGLEVERSSPFPPDETVWGWRSHRLDEYSLAVQVALASRKTATFRLETVATGGDRSEVWALAGDRPIVIKGFGESLRRSSEVRQTRLRIGLSILVLAGLGLLVALPFFQMRKVVFDAQDRFATLQAASAPAITKRDALGRIRQQSDAINQTLQGQTDLLGLLEVLSQVVPDSTYLSNLEARGSTVKVTGHGPAASAVVDMLGATPQFASLRSTSAIAKFGREGEERFSVEFEYRGSRSDSTPSAGGDGE